MTIQDQRPRVRILQDAISATRGDRNRSYGDPVIQLGFSGRLKKELRIMHGAKGRRHISNAEWEAIEMIAMELSRLVLGSSPGRDTYIDIAGYASIGGEAMLTAARLEDEAQAPKDT